MRRALLALAVAPAVVLSGCPQGGEQWTPGDEPYGDACDCAPLPAEWSRPVTLWQGQPDDAPPCPDDIAWEGWVPLAEPPVCPACSCGPAEVTCAPPATWTARSAGCAYDAQDVIDISPPAGWDGSCITAGSIDAGQMCSGDPCLWSVDFGEPELSLAPCEPVETSAPEDGFAPTFVRACEAPREACADGWCGGAWDCVFRRGEHECPAPWDERTVLLETVGDAGDCTPCECGPSTGGYCLMFAGMFMEGDCTVPLYITPTPLNTCATFSDVIAPGSKSAELLSATPGSCAPTGGELAAPPPDPVTFCCR